MNDKLLMEALESGRELPDIVELTNPRSLISLAATALNQMYPELDKMVVLMVCHTALQKLVNNEIKERGEALKNCSERGSTIIVSE